MGIDVEALTEAHADSDTPASAARPINGEVAQLFDEIGDILEIKGEQPFKVNAYRVAARNVARTPQRLDDLFVQGKLREIRGVGPALEAKIVEYLSTGRLEYYERLKHEFPAGLVSLLEVPGLGPSKARTLYQELRVTGIADLERCAREGRLAGVSGFGERAVEKLLQALERMKQRTTRSLISSGWGIAEDVRQALADNTHTPPEQLLVAGSVRRMRETIGNVDLVGVGGPTLLDALVSLPNVVQTLSRDAQAATVLLYGGVEVRLHLASAKTPGAAWLWHTGSREHVQHLTEMAAGRGLSLSEHGLWDKARGRLVAGQTEQSIYAALDMQFVPPELREEDGSEIEAALRGELPRLIELSDLRGDLHCHTSWTDGSNTLEEMAEAARAKGYDYIALTDHSQSLTITRGLTPERLAEARRLVERLNRKLAPFVILLGTEMDILTDGSLDYSDEVLGRLDYVSASVHSGFAQSQQQMTERIVRAISNPLVNTLNHPHGRLLRKREAYAVDMEAVVHKAVAADCALELNAQPERLDLDGGWARRARTMGAHFTISSDAHSIRNLDLMRYGVGSARRGWLTAADVLNTRPLAELRAALKQRRST